MAYNYKSLNPAKALIWRIIHKDNLSWVLDNGLHCGNSDTLSSDWVHIGSEDLINKRSNHPISVPPGGVLNDYVPFYFTPFSVMMRNINTGWGITKRHIDEILILVSSMHKIKELDLQYLFTDSHAYYQWTNYYDDLADLNQIDWPILQGRDFKRNPDDPAKFERYQAEALIYKYCPISALLGIVCHSGAVKSVVEKLINNRNLSIEVKKRTNWYFK